MSMVKFMPTMQGDRAGLLSIYDFLHTRNLANEISDESNKNKLSCKLSTLKGDQSFVFQEKNFEIHNENSDTINLIENNRDNPIISNTSINQYYCYADEINNIIIITGVSDNASYMFYSGITAGGKKIAFGLIDNYCYYNYNEIRCSKGVLNLDNTSEGFYSLQMQQLPILLNNGNYAQKAIYITDPNHYLLLAGTQYDYVTGIKNITGRVTYNFTSYQNADVYYIKSSFHTESQDALNNNTGAYMRTCIKIDFESSIIPAPLTN